MEDQELGLPKLHMGFKFPAPSGIKELAYSNTEISNWWVVKASWKGKAENIWETLIFSTVAILGGIHLIWAQLINKGDTFNSL